MPDITAVRSVSMGCAALVLFAGCLTPPCNCAEANTAADASGAAAPAAGSTEGAAPSAAPAGAQVVWDGDETGTAAKGWANCDSDSAPNCKSALASTAGAGRNNSVGLKFTGEGKGWVGGGWNLFNWWPKDAGLDISDTTHLVLWVKVEAKDAKEGVDPNAIRVGLKCSTDDKCASNEASLAKYTKGNLLDAQWHEIAIPLADVNKPAFDKKKVWEVLISAWSETPKNFTVYVDDISFQKR